MNNQITASVKFYFKGEKFTASVELDIDQHMQASGKLPALYPMLSKSINLDPYSYEYEMLQAETILFSKAKGLITHYVNEGLLDFDSFKDAWAQTQTLAELQQIAQQYLSVDDLEQQPDLKNALLQAYQLGAEAKIKT